MSETATLPGRQSPSTAACPAVEAIVGPDRPGLHRQVIDATSSALTEQLERRCRRLLATRLDAALQASFRPVLAQAGWSTGLVDDALPTLDVADVVLLLRNRPDSGFDILLRALAASPDPMLREAALSPWDPPGLAATAKPSRHDPLCIDRLLAGLSRCEPDLQKRNEAGRQLRNDPFQALEETGDTAEAMLPMLLRQPDDGAAARCLARSAMVTEAIVMRAIRQRDARALVSLAWKAGFSMKTAIFLQAGLAGIPPGQLLRPTETGACPLGRAEIAWKLRALSEALD